MKLSWPWKKKIEPHPDSAVIGDGPLPSPFFNDPARLAALITESESWIGTPFMPNSAQKRKGASCQKMAAAIYRAVGFWTGDDPPDVNMSHARYNRESLVVPYLNACPQFRQIENSQSSILNEVYLPGDLLGFFIHRAIHHVGILLDEYGKFIHAIEGVGANYSYLSDPTWGPRLGAVWRPI